MILRSQIASGLGEVFSALIPRGRKLHLGSAIVALGLFSVATGGLLGMDHLVLGVSLALVPLAFRLFKEHKWLFNLYAAVLPLELVLVGDAVTMPKVIGLAALAAFVISLIGQRRKLRWDTPLTFMAAYCVWAVVSLIWSDDRSASSITTVTYSLLTIQYFLLVNSVNSRETLQHMLVALAIGGAVLVGSGAFELLGGGYANRIGGRLTGLAFNANYYVLWCLAIVPAIYQLGSYGKVVRYARAVVFVSMGLTCVLTQSRGGLISFGVFILTFLGFTRRRIKPLLILSFVVVLLWQFAPPIYWDRFARIGSDSNDRLTELWPAGFAAFTHSPLLGYGVGTNGRVLMSYASGSEQLASVHSAPLAVSMELGLIGLFLYLMFLLAAMLPLFSLLIRDRRDRQDPLRETAILVFACTVGFLASWIKGGALEFSKILWLLLGLCSVCARLLRPAAEGDGSQHASHVEAEV